MKLLTIETERMLLKAFTPEVYHYTFTTMNDKEIMLFFGHQTDKELQVEKERFTKGMTTFNKSFLFFQLRDEISDTYLGWCGYHTWYTTHDRAELFYMLMDEKQRRKGLISEALSAVLKYGFDQMKLERIEAFVGEQNIASLATLKRFNFKQEGVFRKHYKIDGENQDSLAFGLLKSEFQS
jgi:ribosomal-protein-alanine N-acetyltransferase